MAEAGMPDAVVLHHLQAFEPEDAALEKLKNVRAGPARCLYVVHI